MGWKKAAGAVAAAVLLTVPTAGEAAGAVTSARGTTGTVAMAEPSICRHMKNGSTSLSIGGIRVYAPRGMTARVRARHVTSFENGEFTFSGWMGWQWVSPSRSAAYPGTTLYSYWKTETWGGFLVEFYNAKGRYIGKRFITSNRYNFINVYGVGPTGPFRSCRGILT